jgi:hypothetical protein
VAQGTHAATIYWVSLNPFDLFGVPIHDSYLNSARRIALAAYRRSPDGFTGQLTGSPDPLHDELFFIGATRQGCRTHSNRGCFQEIFSAQYSPFNRG